MSEPGSTRLRGVTLLAAPLFILGVIGCSFALATGLWGTWNTSDLGVAFWATLLISAALGLSAFAAGRGCFIEVSENQVRDVVAWRTVRRVDREQIVTARVRAGAWRWFELEMTDSTVHTLVGASPSQFPSRLLEGSREHDLADLDTLLGED